MGVGGQGHAPSCFTSGRETRDPFYWSSGWTPGPFWKGVLFRYCYEFIFIYHEILKAMSYGQVAFLSYVRHQFLLNLQFRCPHFTSVSECCVVLCCVVLCCVVLCCVVLCCVVLCCVTSTFITYKICAIHRQNNCNSTSDMYSNFSCTSR